MTSAPPASSSPGGAWSFDCHTYPDDAAACVAEDALAGTVAEGGCWSDAAFRGGGALYRDPLRPSAGAPHPDLVVWQRISEGGGPGGVASCDTPVLFGEGPGAGEVCQGQLADRWLLNAVSLACTDRAMLMRLFVSSRYRTKGLYTLKFFKAGQWRYVHVDDTIPCNHLRVPIFARGNNPNETGVMLVEKAFAKIHGCYENLLYGATE